MRTPRKRLGKNERQHIRRTIVLRWYLSGYLLDGVRTSKSDLAVREGVSDAVIDKDIKACKQYMASLIKSTPMLRQEGLALLQTIIQQAQEDRGRALEQFEELNKEMHRPDGSRKKTVTKYNTDLGYQMVAFLRQAQQSTEVLSKLLRDMTGKGDINILFVDNSQHSNQFLTVERAVRELDERGLTRALPSSTESNNPMVDIKKQRDYIVEAVD